MPYDHREKDDDNVTFTHDISTLYDEDRKPLSFQREKFSPVLDAFADYFLPRKPLTEVRLLDVGVGYGAFLRLCELRGMANLWGMDPFPESIRITSQFTSAELKENSIEKAPWPFDTDMFDVVTCLDVVEHLEAPRMFFDHVRPHLAEGAIVVVRTPNGQFPYRMRRIPVIGIPDQNPTHINIHEPSWWRRLARDAGWKVLKDWRGEHLSHVKPVANLFGLLCRITGMDHRRIPFLRPFQQGFIMIVRPGTDA